MKYKDQAHCLVGQPGLTMWNQRILFWTVTLVHPCSRQVFHSQLVRPNLENIVNHPAWDILNPQSKQAVSTLQIRYSFFLFLDNISVVSNLFQVKQELMD